MRVYQLFALTLLSIDVNFCWAQTLQPKAILQGSVVNSINGQALKNVHLVLQPEDHTVAGERATSTSANGAFQFQNVDPGKYRLFAERLGYEPQYFASSGMSVYRGTVLNAESAASIKDLTIKLNPYGAVSGRVFDEDGEPLAHVSVQALHYIYLAGKRQLMASGQAITDDLGGYRIFDLPAGRYIVQAKAAGDFLLIGQRHLSYLAAYYPNAEDPRSAADLPIAPGQVQPGVDFSLRRVPTVSVRGSIAAMPGEPRGAMVYLLPRNLAGLAEKSPVPVVDGHFEIPSVSPGAYTLAADQYGESGGAVSSSRLELEVRDQDIDGIALVLTRPGELRGRVQLEYSSTSARSSELADGRARAVQISLQRLDDSSSLAGATAGDDGKFHMKGVNPGLYRVLVNNLRDGLYVKSIRVGDYDVLETGLNLTRGGVAGEMAIVLSANGGTVSGTARSENGASPGGVEVLAIATSGLRRPKSAITDQSGHYEIKGLAPGDYRVFAFQEIEPGAAEDADFMLRFNDKGSKVTLRELSTESAQPETIPAALTRGAR